MRRAGAAGDGGTVFTWYVVGVGEEPVARCGHTTRRGPSGHGTPAPWDAANQAYQPPACARPFLPPNPSKKNRIRMATPLIIRIDTRRPIEIISIEAE